MVVSVTSFTQALHKVKSASSRSNEKGFAFIISIYDLAYELFSIACLHTVYDSGITQLRFRSGIWWKKSQLHIFKIIDIWMGGTVVHYHENLAFLSAHCFINISNPLSEEVCCHPCFFVSSVFDRQLLYSFKSTRIFAFPYD